MSRRVLLILCVLSLTACASVQSLDGTRYRVASAAFRDYVEQVFRAQNQIADELAFALEDLSPQRSDQARRLEVAEEELLQACSGLNELAVSRRDRDRPGSRQSLKAARSAPDCERAVQQAASLLRVLN